MTTLNLQNSQKGNFLKIIYVKVETLEIPSGNFLTQSYIYINSENFKNFKEIKLESCNLVFFKLWVINH